MRDVFGDRMRSIGLGEFEIEWRVCPHIAGSALLERAKAYARMLEQASTPTFSPSHMAALELVARSVSFRDWHHFQSAARRTILRNADDDFGLGVGEDRRFPALESMSSAFPLAISIPPNCPAEDAQVRGLQTLVDGMTAATGLSSDDVTGIVARVAAGDSWSNMLSRRPESSESPMYAFRAAGDDDFMFVRSPTCEWLLRSHEYEVRALSRWNQRGFALPDQSDLIEVAGRRPDFLQGHLAKGDRFLLDGKLRDAIKAYRAGVMQAEALIPPRFKGHISWMYRENRVYLLLLYGEMRARSMLEVSVTKPIALARRYLRRNPDDKLRVATYLPVLLLRDGQTSAALKASSLISGRYSDNEDINPSYVRSLCALLNGEAKAGIGQFVWALFQFPFLRCYIEGSLASSDLGSPQYKRGTWPDLEALYEFHDACVEFFPAVAAVFKAVIAQPEVVEAEARLGALFQSNADAWWEAASAEASQCAEALIKNPAVLAETETLARLSRTG